MTTETDNLVVLRCNASPAVGLGHQRRCEALAGALRRAGWICAFANSGETPEILRDKWPGGAAVLVVDGYDLDAEFESACRPWAERIVAIDDLADRPHDADILVDHNIGRVADDYRALVGDDCRVLAGAGFSLIAAEYRRLREKGVPRTIPGDREIQIAVSLGGGNSDVTERALAIIYDAIDMLKSTRKTTVVVSTDAQAKSAMARGHTPRTGLSADEMAQLFARADIAVGAGGVSLLERCCLGVPGLVMTVAANQRPGTEAANAVGACRDMGPAERVSPGAIAKAIDDLVENAAEWRDFSDAASRLTDGCGADRVAAALSTNNAATADQWVSLRRAAFSDADILLTWQKQPGARRYARNPDIPEPDEHAAWLEGRLALGGCILNIVQVDETPAGMLRLDRLSGDRRGYEVSILTVPEFQGRGVARAALDQAAIIAGDEPIWAWVAEENTASLALFRSAGYRPSGDGWYVSESARFAA